jgi:hypothetical protein
MAMHAERSLGTVDLVEIHSQVQAVLRFGETARGFLEELIDSTRDDRVISRAGRALDSIEEALDQASQALFASEATVRQHIESMIDHADRGVERLSAAVGQEAA